MNIKLRPYQEEALKVMKNTKLGEPSLIVLPTGSGKGTLFAALANQANGRVLIVVPSGELLIQGIQKIKQFDENADVGTIKASINQFEAKILCGTRQSLISKKRNRIEKMLEHGEIEYVILDEAHLAVDQLKSIINKVKNVKIIGMSATPYNNKMNTIFKKIDYEKSIFDMIMENYLCEPKAIMVESTTDISKIKMVAGDFKQDELEKTVNNVERNQLIVKSYEKFALERKATIIFCTGIDHCNSLLEEFKLAGYECGSIDSRMNKEDRDSTLAKFESGSIKILLNVNILSTGYDLPKIDCVILAKPTRSKIFFVQAIGRGLRVFPEKVDSLIIDISDNCRAHDLMSLSNIFNMKIMHGETTKKAYERNKKEKEDEDKRRVEEEERRKAREKLKQEEMKIVAQQIKLFNKDMKLAFQDRRYDWWKCDNLTYALTYAMNEHYVIENYNEGFNILRVNTDKENKSAEIIENKVNITDAIQYIEKKVRPNGYSDPNTDWKKAKPSEKQLKYCSWAQSSWDVTKYFTSSTVTSLVKKANREAII